MGRTVQDADLGTRTARARLTETRKPIWRLLERGLHIGYRRGPRGGVWFARRFAEGVYSERQLGNADDATDADGVTVLNFGQAQEAARKWWQTEERKAVGLEPVAAGPYTVADALRDYFAARTRKGSKGVAGDRTVSDARIIPQLGSTALGKLTTAKIRRWHEDLAASPKLVRTKAKAKERKTKALDPNDPDAIRARRSSANRQLTVLKAALNHAFQEGHAGGDDAWRKVKPFRSVDAAVVRYLSKAECVRLVNASDPDFRNLVRGALLTGCRYGELARMRAHDFNADAGTVAVRESKSGKPRHVVLTDEGQRLFATLTAGKLGTALVFVRENGKAWKASEQQRPLEEACKRAEIAPAATFHVLRHTHASHLAMQGVPMGVIAAQLGHVDTRMTEKHYAHLAPNYVADTIRAHFPTMGIGESSGVVGMGRR